jgi:hypothetical protein
MTLQGLEEGGGVGKLLRFLNLRIKKKHGQRREAPLS